MEANSPNDKVDWAAYGNRSSLHHRHPMWRETRVCLARSVPATKDDLCATTPFHCYANFGGLADGDALITRMRAHMAQPISRLARWIVAREVLHFDWHGEPYFPLFQFNPADMTLHRELCSVIAELSGAIDDLALGFWFAKPNTFLGNREPAAVLRDDATAVMAAARAERFSIKG